MHCGGTILLGLLWPGMFEGRRSTSGSHCTVHFPQSVGCGVGSSRALGELSRTSLVGGGSQVYKDGSESRPAGRYHAFLRIISWKAGSAAFCSGELNAKGFEAVLFLAAMRKLARAIEKGLQVFVQCLDPDAQCPFSSDFFRKGCLAVFLHARLGLLPGLCYEVLPSD